MVSFRPQRVSGLHQPTEYSIYSFNANLLQLSA